MVCQSPILKTRGPALYSNNIIRFGRSLSRSGNEVVKEYSQIHIRGFHKLRFWQKIVIWSFECKPAKENSIRLFLYVCCRFRAQSCLSIALARGIRENFQFQIPKNENEKSFLYFDETFILSLGFFSRFGLLHLENRILVVLQKGFFFLIIFCQKKLKPWYGSGKIL